MRAVMALTRRELVHTLGATAGIGWLERPVLGASVPEDADRTVHLSGDGVGLSPRGYTSLLTELSGRADVREDSYLLGGEIERFEHHWATLLGKETAVFMPSGTLANHLALRALAGPKRRVIVPEMSHVYNDTGDACQTLSGLTLMPLAAGAATFTRADVEAVLTRTASGRVAADVGAVLIESPVRRLLGQMFDWDEAKRITAFARERGIGTHLDGARLFIASAYTGVTPAEYTPRRSTRSTSRSGSTSTAASGRSWRDRSACSTACSTLAACSAAISPWGGRRRWSPGTTWTASSIA